MYNFESFPILITERLRLRALHEIDFPAIQFLRSDPGVNEFVNRPACNNEEEARAFYHKIMDQFEQQLSLYWSIMEQSQAQMIGSICIWNFSEDRRTAEVGFDLSTAHQRKGIMSEALQVVKEFGFDQLELDKIEAYTHHQNPASIKLLEKFGFILKVGEKDPWNENNIVFSCSA